VQPKLVRIFMSVAGSDGPYTAIHEGPGGVTDSTLVGALTNGALYYFRIAWYDSSGRTLGHFDPIMVSPGVYSPAMRETYGL